MYVARWTLAIGLGMALCLGAGSIRAQDAANKDQNEDKATRSEERTRQKTEKTSERKDASQKRTRIVHTELIALKRGTGVRSSTLTGLDVVNEKGKSLGSVSDMVIDLETGQIQYVATSYGGFLGIGDKLFAIPWKSLRFTHDKGDPDQRLLVLDMPQEALENAPGFNQNAWPGTEESEYWVKVDKFYKVPADASAERAKDATKQ